MSDIVTPPTSQVMPRTGQWGWYRDHEGRDYRRVSKLLEYLETRPGTYNLRAWQERQVAEGLALRDDLVLSIKAMGRPDPIGGWSQDDKRKLDELVSDAKRAAKQRDGARAGTAVHDLTERLDRGEPLEDVVRGLPALTAEEIRAYEFLLRVNGWRVTEVERTVQVEALGDLTGSLDREYEIPGLTALLGQGECQHGHWHDSLETVIGDVKTEAKPWLNGMHIAPQLATYSRATKMWRATGGTHTVRKGDQDVQVPNGEYVPAPCVRQDVAVVVHVHDGRAHPLFVRLDAGWRAAQRAYAQLLDETEAKRAIGARGAWFAPLPDIIEPRPAQLLTEQAAAANYADPNRPDYKVGDTVTVSGIDFVKHSEGPATLMIGDKVAGEPGDTLTQNGATTHVAVRRDDGLVEWRPVGDVNGQPEPDVDNLPRMLITQIWQATTVDRLGELWELARKHSVPWRGPVEQAGTARLRQIECPQRALHAGDGKCACGWVTGVAA